MGSADPRILLIDDDEDSVLITTHHLTLANQRCAVESVNGYDEGLETLLRGVHDVCLLDYRLGARNGLDLLKEAVAAECRVPIILLTGQGDAEVDEQAMKAGAVDYFDKQDLGSRFLSRSILYAVERRRAEETRLQAMAHLQLVSDQLPIGMWTTDNRLRFTSSLRPDFLGGSLFPNPYVGQSLVDQLGGAGSESQLLEAHRRALEGKSSTLEREHSRRKYHVRIDPYTSGNGKITGTVGVALDVTERRRVEEGFLAAQGIQEHLLPSDPPQLPGFDIAGLCRPAEHTGGDFFDYCTMHDDTLGVVVADVSSHGFASAMIMAGTRRVLRTLVQERDDLSTILESVNRAVVEDTLLDKFVTMFFAWIDPNTRQLIYSGAGHEGYVLGIDNEWTRLTSTSVPLGLDKDFPMPCGEPRVLQPGELLFMCTDGFNEAMAPNGPDFGTERTLEFVAEHRNRSAEDILELLYAEVVAFCQPERHHDDVTGVIVKVDG